MLIELCCNVQQRLLTQIFLDIVGDDLGFFGAHEFVNLYAPNFGTFVLERFIYSKQVNLQI